MEEGTSIEESQTPRKTPRKKHRRAKSNLESKQEKIGSSDPLITDENPRVLKARSQTKARFEALLQESNVESAADEPKPEESIRKKKKKRRTRSAEGVLENIRSKSPLNKERSRSSENLLGSEDERNDEKENIHEDQYAADSARVTPKKNKHRSKTQEKVETPSTAEKPRRRRKKQNEEDRAGVAGVDETDQGATGQALGQDNDGYQPETQAIAEGPQAEGTEAEVAESSKGKKGKRKVALTLPTPERISRALEKKRHDDGTVLSVKVHKTDRLKPDLNISHPMVRVHVVDQDTGHYVLKSSRGRNVASYYHDDEEHIMPVMTQPYEFKKQLSIIPEWEEILIFNEIFSYFLKREEGDPNMVLFFEVLDFLSTNATARSRAYKSGRKVEMGWHKIAWGFLKVVGSNGMPNTDKMIRLQLYEPPQNLRSSMFVDGIPEVYSWWLHPKRTPYPSTLFVTLKGVKPPENVDPSTRSMFAIQEERGKVTFKEIQELAERQKNAGDSERKGGPKTWTRLPGQVNRIPNKEILSLPSKKTGCFVVKFSNDGQSLACACGDRAENPILVYEIPSGEFRGKFSGHFSLVYDIDWSPDNKLVLSASSDGTARAWDADSMTSDMMKVFPHPSFVYTAKFHPAAPYLVLTGGYDKLLRVWSIASEGINAQLLREIDGHLGFINSICFDAQGQTLFSGDSEGCILMWNVFVDPRASSRKKKRGIGGTINDWVILKTLKDAELKGVIINSLSFHPSGRKLLIHCRDNVIRMLDLRSFSILHRYYGNQNSKEHIRSTLSSCGSFVFSGSEDGKVYVWNAENATLVSVFQELGFQGSATDVDFHPHDNIIAFCSYNVNEPIIVYHYDIKAAREEALKLQPLLPQAGPPLSPVRAPTTPAIRQTVNFNTTADSYDGVSASPVKDTMRLKKLQETLNTVMSPSKQPGSSRLHLNSTVMSTPAGVSFSPLTPGAYQTPGRAGVTMSTWGSDFSASQMPDLNASVSPHVKQYLGSSGFFQVPQPTFGPQAGPIDSPLRMSQLRSQRQKGAPDRVVVMFPYEACRSDELSIVPGDIIQVIKKESANWWFGQLADGRQGYFPSNYVTEPEEPEEDLQETSINKNNHMSAVVGKQGDLKIMSGPEESHSETDLLQKFAKEKKHKKRKEKKERSSHSRTGETV